MRKITLFVVVVSLLAISSALMAGDKDYPQFKFGGRITIELITENNMTDFTDYDYDKDAGTVEGNDVAAYGQARTDLNFKTMITENICAVINTRFESENGDKWMIFGANNDADNWEDSSPKLQEAYIGFKKLFIDQLNGEIGRKVYKMGSGNVMSDKDKVDGFRIGAKFGAAYINYQYILREQYNNYWAVDSPVQYTIWGLNGGVDKLADMVDINGYFWWNYMQLQDPENADDFVNDNLWVLGVRGDLNLVDGMLTPFMEVAFQFGAAEKSAAGGDDYNYSGYLFDLGTGFELEAGSVGIDANIEFFSKSGDDADTADENECWQGIGLGNRELGYMSYNIASSTISGLNMFSIGGGVTMMENLRIGLDLYSFMDNSANYKNGNGDEISGEPMWDELDLEISYEMAKKTKLYTLVGLLFPNKDYMGGEDMAAGWLVGAETKW